MKYKIVKLVIGSTLSILSWQTIAFTWQYPGSPVMGNTIEELCVNYQEYLNKWYEGRRSPNRVEYLRSGIHQQYKNVPESNLKARGFCVMRIIGSSNSDYYYGNLNGDGCPVGKSFDWHIMQCIDKKRKKCRVGNPVEVDSGRKFEHVIDHRFRKNNVELVISRSYKSQVNLELASFDNAQYGGNWSFSHLEKVSLYDGTIMGAEVKIVTIVNDGEDLIFLSSNNQHWRNVSGSSDRLEFSEIDGINYWKLIQDDNKVLLFNIDGKLNQISDPTVGILNFTYRIQNENTNRIEYIDVSVNEDLVFTYRYDGKNITSLLDSNSETIIDYRYNDIGNLTEVEYFSGDSIKYHYENAHFHKLLTGITDELGVRYATWAYDAQGRAISSEHAGGAEKTLLAFNADGSTTVTNALNKQTIYRFADIAGARRVTKVEGQPTANCIGANQDYTYTPEGWIASKTDWKGIKTTFTYNTAGQEISRTEAFGTPEARTTTTEWHPTLFVKTKITEPEKETVYSYDANGRLLNQSTQSISVQ